MPRVLLIGVRSDPEAAISKRSQLSPCEDTQCWCLGRPIQVNRWWNFDIGALQGASDFRIGTGRHPGLTAYAGQESQQPAHHVRGARLGASITPCAPLMPRNLRLSS